MLDIDHDASKDAVVNFVAKRAGYHPSIYYPCETFAVRDPAGVMIGAVVWHQYQKLPHGNVITLSFASSTPRWVSRRVLRAMFAYPFGELGCVRVQGAIRKSNRRSRDFARRIGCVLEGTLRRAHDGRESIMIYSLLKEECRWVE